MLACVCVALAGACKLPTLACTVDAHVRPAAGTLDPPVLTGPQTSATSASVAWAAVSGAGQYTLTATRSGSQPVSATLTAAEHAALTGGRSSLNLGRGQWLLTLTASNSYSAPGDVTYAASTSSATVTVTVGVPDAPVLGTPSGGEGQITVPFRWGPARLRRRSGGPPRPGLGARPPAPVHAAFRQLHAALSCAGPAVPPALPPAAAR